MAHRLEDMIAEAVRQRDEVSELLGGMDEAQATRRTDGGRWSAAEHIAHLTLTDRPYFPAIEEPLLKARAAGRLADGPFRGGAIGNWFARILEPPPKRRMRTPKKLEPSRDLDRETVAAEFVACRDELIALMRSADGVNLDRAVMRSPFLAILRMPVSSAFEVLLSHGRRHIWLAREAAPA